jgi:hypothetical protein
MTDGAGAESRTGRGEAGLSLLEVVISLAILSMLFLVILRSTLSVADSNTSMESFNAILVKTQAAMAELHEDVSTCRRTWIEDATGRGYFDALEFGATPRATSCLLPIIDPLGEFTLDVPADRKTGNSLLLAGEMAPHDFIASDARAYRVNVYRLVCYYVADYGFPVAPGLSRFDLVRWESMAFADWATLTAISNATARQEMVADLVNTANIKYAWDPSQAVTAAFFELDTDVAVTPEATFSIPASPVQARYPKAYYRRYNASLSQNNTITGTEAAVPKFTQPLALPAPGFPHGFEVKIVGPSGARKIKTRIVAERMMRNQVFRAASETISTMRDI